MLSLLIERWAQPLEELVEYGIKYRWWSHRRKDDVRQSMWEAIVRRLDAKYDPIRKPRFSFLMCHAGYAQSKEKRRKYQPEFVGVENAAELSESSEGDVIDSLVVREALERVVKSDSDRLAADEMMRGNHSPASMSRIHGKSRSWWDVVRKRLLRRLKAELEDSYGE